MRTLKDILKELEEDGFFVVDAKAIDDDQKAKSDDPPLDYVFRKGVDVNQRALDGDTPLHRICFNGNLEDMEILIANGAEINAPGDTGNTPLHEAISFGPLEMVKRLLELGADPTIENEFNETALDWTKNGLNIATFEKDSSKVAKLKKNRQNSRKLEI